jgi:hypothetical protein
MRVVFVLLIRRNCHGPSLRESAREKSGRVVRTILFKIEQCSTNVVSAPHQSL